MTSTGSVTVRSFASLAADKGISSGGRLDLTGPLSELSAEEGSVSAASGLSAYSAWVKAAGSVTGGVGGVFLNAPFEVTSPWHRGFALEAGKDLTADTIQVQGSFLVNGSVVATDVRFSSAEYGRIPSHQEALTLHLTLHLTQCPYLLHQAPYRV